MNTKIVTISDLPLIIQKAGELYPESITKKALINAKHLFKRLASSFVLEDLFSKSFEELMVFCAGLSPRIEFLYSKCMTKETNSFEKRSSVSKRIILSNLKFLMIILQSLKI